MARPRNEAPHFKLVRRGDRYYVRWWESGAWHRISTGTADQRQAQRFLVQFEAGHGTPPPPPSPTIGAILDGYLKNREGQVRSYGTLQAACSALRRHLGDLEPDHLTEARGRLYATQRRREGHEVGPRDERRRKPTSNGTITREVVTLRAALRWAVRQRWITREPYIPAPPTSPSRDRWLTGEEFDRLLAAATSPHVRLFILLALHTGARTGAILDLEWSQVRLDQGHIRFGQGAGNKGRAVVPINEDLLPALTLAKEARTCDRVIEFAGERVASIKTGFAATVRRAGLSGVTPHILRHTTATWMAMANVPMREIALFLGHRDTATTERVYSHHSPDYLRNAAAVLVRGNPGPLAPKTDAT